MAVLAKINVAEMRKVLGNSRLTSLMLKLSQRGAPLRLQQLQLQLQLQRLRTPWPAPGASNARSTTWHSTRYALRAEGPGRAAFRHPKVPAGTRVK